MREGPEADAVCPPVGSHVFQVDATGDFDEGLRGNLPDGLGPSQPRFRCLVVDHDDTWLEACRNLGHVQRFHFNREPLLGIGRLEGFDGLGKVSRRSDVIVLDHALAAEVEPMRIAPGAFDRHLLEEPESGRGLPRARKLGGTARACQEVHAPPYLRGDAHHATEEIQGHALTRQKGLGIAHHVEDDVTRSNGPILAKIRYLGPLQLEDTTCHVGTHEVTGLPSPNLGMGNTICNGSLARNVSFLTQILLQVTKQPAIHEPAPPITLMKRHPSSRSVRVGIIGCGAIGSQVARAASSMEDIQEVHLYDLDPLSLEEVAKEVRGIASPDAATLVANCDVVVEAANKGVVQTSILSALQQGKRALVLTVGALADDELRATLLAAARENHTKLHLPSGAIMGVDGLRAAAEGHVKSVTLVTTKPNAGLSQDVDRWTLLFNGCARDAVEAFPKNVNVAATLAMAGVGFDSTWVQVAVDPLAALNSHKVIIEGDFGRARIEVENLPSPTNPRTSYLASLSAIAALRRIVSPIEVGA